MLKKLLAASLLISCCGIAALAGNTRSGSGRFFCGGETTQAEVDRYFARLKTAIKASSPKNRFNEFVAPKFRITNERGRTLVFNLEDFNSITPGRIPLKDWQEISARGPDQVENMGWRGCMMNHGKVWFESNETKGLELKGLNRSMVWEQVRR